MRALNIKVGDTQGQTEPVYNPYKDSLNNVLDSDIDNIVANTIDMNLCLLRKTTSITQPRTPFDVPLPLELFSEIVSGGDKNSSPSAKGSSSPMLSPSIVPKEPSNLLLKSSGNYGKLRKGKPRAALISRGLGDLGYITNQYGSQGASIVSKSNANGTKNSWQNQTQNGTSVV